MVKQKMMKIKKAVATTFAVLAFGAFSAKAMPPDTLAAANAKPAVEQKVKGYPFIGCGTNFTTLSQLGNFGYAFSDFSSQVEGPKAGLQLNDEFGGLRINAVAIDGSASLAFLRPIGKGFVAGINLAGLKSPTYAIGYLPVHNDWMLLRSSAHYDVASQAYGFGMETRFSLDSKLDLTVAAQTRISKLAAPMHKGGIQIAYDFARLAASSDGKRHLLAAQLSLGNYLPDFGINLSSGKIQSGWVGITYMLDK